MTKAFSDYLAERPTVSAALGASDKLLVLQGGTVKVADPQYSAVTLDTGGSGKRCQVQATYVGLADDGVTEIWDLKATPLA